jgi:hypothetical protein
MRTARTFAVVAFAAYGLVAGGCAGPDTVTEPTITVTSPAAAAHPTAHVAPAHLTKAPTAAPIPVASGFNHAAAKAAGATAISHDGSRSYSAGSYPMPGQSMRRAPSRIAAGGGSPRSR